LLIPKRLIFNSDVDSSADSTTGERRYLVQSLDVHHRIRGHSELRGHSERMAMPLRLAREESTREHRVDVHQQQAIPVLLTYTVEQTLLGNAGDLKEPAQRVKDY